MRPRRSVAYDFDRSSAVGTATAAGVGDVAQAVGEAQAYGLDHVVVRLRRLEAHPGDVVALHDVHGQQRHEALAVGRALPDRDAPVVGRDRLVPRRGVGRQVFGGQPAAFALHEARDALGQRPLVEGVRASVRDVAQDSAQLRQAHHVARSRRAAPQQKLVARGSTGEPVEALAPLVRHHGRDGVALLRVGDGRLQHVGQGHRAVAVQRRLPRMDRARDGDGVRALVRDACVSLP